jgi:small-conductance mechanosensitive channel
MDDVSRWLDAHGPQILHLVSVVLTFAVAVAAALGIHRLAQAALRRAAERSRSKTDDVLLAAADRPVQWMLVVLAIGFAHRMVPLAPWVAAAWVQAVGFLFPALLGWLLVALLKGFQQSVAIGTDIMVADNLTARRRRTRVNILTNIAVALVIFLAVAMMLLSIPGVRNVGVTLMASAGLAGLAVGAAAQPALRNLIAGIQMAFTEPIRIDDVVIVGGEWGRIEEIRLTYVVVRIWDDRRLIVPVAVFLEQMFQNWTRESARIMGSVFLYVDPSADLEPIRARLKEVVEASPRFDGRFYNLQVTDMKPEAIELRILVTSADSGRNFDLRCEVREALIRFMASEMPGALVRTRLQPLGGEQPGPPAPGPTLQ